MQTTLLSSDKTSFGKVSEDQKILNFYFLMKKGAEVIWHKENSETEIVVLSLKEESHNLYFCVGQTKIPIENLSIIEKYSTDKQFYIGDYLVELDTSKSRYMMIEYIEKLRNRPDLFFPN